MLKRYLSFVVFMLCIAGTIIDDSRAAIYFAKGQLSNHLLTLPVGLLCTVVVLLLVFYPVNLANK
ncbi:hypothetical protein P4S72_05480 [Vibrio sp. PP-XX7]